MASGPNTTTPTPADLASVLASIDLSNFSPAQCRQRVADSGLVAIDLPQRVGGFAYDPIAAAKVFRLAGRSSCELRETVGGGHARLLLHRGTRKHDKLLADVVSGKAYVGVGITEEGAGSDIRAISSTLQPNDGGYLANVKKQYVGRILEATHFVVFANVQRTGLQADQTLTAFVVPKERLTVTHVYQTLGLSKTSFGSFEMDNVHIDRDSIIVGEGAGFSIFHHHFAYWRTAMAAVAIGSATQTLSEIPRWLKSREAFGGNLVRFTHLQQELARHFAAIELAWLGILKAMTDYRTGFARSTFPLIVKIEAIQAAKEVTRWAMQVMGARGYVTESSLGQRLSDLEGLTIADGTPDVLRTQIARALLGEDVYRAQFG